MKGRKKGQKVDFMTCSSFLKGSCWEKEVRKGVEGRRKHHHPAGERRRSGPGPFLLAWEAGGEKCFLLLQSHTRRRSSSPCVRKAFTQPGQ